MLGNRNRFEGAEYLWDPLRMSSVSLRRDGTAVLDRRRKGCGGDFVSQRQWDYLCAAICCCFLPFLSIDRMLCCVSMSWGILMDLGHLATWYGVSGEAGYERQRQKG
jgi:hypothetical protein